MTQDALTHEDELRGYVETWWRSVDDLTQLLEELGEEDWATPTDLAGWDVHAVVAHVAHLESLLAGKAHQEVELGDVPHVRNAMGTFTEQGVVLRRSRTPDDLIIELRESSTSRRTALLADPPTDPDAAAQEPFGMLGWSTRTLLRNRPLDVWMHEQDIRRAVGRPGNLDTPGALHTVDYLSESLGLVLAKRVGAGPGTTLVLQVEGLPARAFVVNDQRRGERLEEAPTTPDVTIACDVESFALLAGGRRTPPAGAVVTGDAELGERVLAAMAVTP